MGGLTSHHTVMVFIAISVLLPPTPATAAVFRAAAGPVRIGVPCPRTAGSPAALHHDLSAAPGQGPPPRPGPHRSAGRGVPAADQRLPLLRTARGPAAGTGADRRSRPSPPGGGRAVGVEMLAVGEVDGRCLHELVDLVGVVTAVAPLRLVPELSHSDLLTEHGLQTSAEDERTVAEALARQVEYAGTPAARNCPRRRARRGCGPGRRCCAGSVPPPAPYDWVPGRCAAPPWRAPTSQRPGTGSIRRRPCCRRPATTTASPPCSGSAAARCTRPGCTRRWTSWSRPPGAAGSASGRPTAPS